MVTGVITPEAPGGWRSPAIAILEPSWLQLVGAVNCAGGTGVSGSAPVIVGGLLEVGSAGVWCLDVAARWRGQRRDACR